MNTYITGQRQALSQLLRAQAAAGIAHQICGCFAGCTTKPLDVINLYARLYGLNNREAIFYLARMLH